MTLSGQTATPPKVAPAPPKPQTVLIGSGGGLFVFTPKHEIAAYCTKIDGKVVSDCKIEAGHTATEVIQSLIDTLVHEKQ